MGKQIETACTYDCPDACALLVQKESGGVEIKGNPDHPITRGFVCKRIRKHVSRLASPNRITSPLLRHGSCFREITWDRALDMVAGALEHTLSNDPSGVIHVMGGGSLGVRKLLVEHFFHSLGPVTTLAGGVCDETGIAAQTADFGDCCGHDYTDLQNSNAIVLWGRNPSLTGIHLLPFIKEAQGRGARVVLIDLWKTPTAAHCDDFIRLAPGGDAWLALAVLKSLLDRGAWKSMDAIEGVDDLKSMLQDEALTVGVLAARAGVDEQSVFRLAKVYGQKAPVATFIGWGLQRRTAGGYSVRAIDALCALSGNVGIAGGGSNYNPGRLRGLDLSMLAKPRGDAIETPFFADMLNSRKRSAAGFIYINGSNPVTQFADSVGVKRALGAGSFVVVADAFLTDTARCADVILPSTLMLEEEHDAVGSYAHHFVSRVQRAMDPPRGVKEDVEIVRRIRKRLGLLSDPLLDDPTACIARMTRDWFSDAGMFCRNPRQPGIPFEEGFKTSSGKMKLVGRLSDRADEDPRYPLLLLSPKRREFEHSQMEPEEQTEPLVCEINPKARGAERLLDGQMASLTSPLGSLTVRVKFSKDLDSGVCVVAQGGWLMFGHAVNALVQQRATDLGQGTAYYDQRVSIEPLNVKEHLSD